MTLGGKELNSGDQFRVILSLLRIPHFKVLLHRHRGLWFKTHKRHCVMSSSKILYSLLYTGKTQEMY